jgi:Calcineurin-like phosphoesterase
MPAPRRRRVTRILAIADEVADALYGETLQKLRPDLIVSCGDLPADYMENLLTRAGVPLVYVLGNHDPDATLPTHSPSAWLPPMARADADIDDRVPAGPEGGDSAEGRIVVASGLRLAGLGGSLRYKRGPNQYSQAEMRRRALRLEARTWLGRALGRGGVDVLVTHAPPLGVGDAPDLPHQGFAAFHRLVRELRPRLLLHGHVHPVHKRPPDRELNSTRVVNVIPYRLLEI